MTGLSLGAEAPQALLNIDRSKWIQEMDEIGHFFGEFGQRVPKELLTEREKIARELREH